MKVILDTDPGIDDALAFILLKAMPEISLQAITTTHGNTTVAKCTDNALKLVELLGMQDIPVAVGAHEPLVKALSVAEETHGDTGLGHHAGVGKAAFEPIEFHTPCFGEVFP